MESIFKETNTPTQADSEDPILLAQLKNGANWFYWIAALSLINSVIFAFEGNLSFVSGLAITQIVDALSDSAVAAGSSETVKAIAIIVDLLFAALFALIGYYANKGMSWVFIVGIIIYGFDALLCLLIESYLGAGFHLFVLFFVVSGFLASRNLARMVLAINTTIP